MEWFEALILGLIQGLTEYLPVSSSGHLAIGSALFGIQGRGKFGIYGGSARSYGVQYNGGLVERNRMDFQGTV